MTDRLVFEDFIGSVHFSSSDDIFYGKLEGIPDLVTFEGSSVEELKKAFQEAVLDYKELCEKTGRNNKRSFKGSFNVRIDPKLHELAFIKATKEGLSLNQFVQQTLKKELSE
jgi:predicted HicB family RNase H-like nuclease